MTHSPYIHTYNAVTEYCSHHSAGKRNRKEDRYKISSGCRHAALCEVQYCAVAQTCGTNCSNTQLYSAPGTHSGAAIQFFAVPALTLQHCAATAAVMVPSTLIHTDSINRYCEVYMVMMYYFTNITDTLTYI
jgi:hypothetical protein